MPAPSATPPLAITGSFTALHTRAHQHERADLVGRRMAARLDADDDHRVDAGRLGLVRVLRRGDRRAAT